MRFLARVNTFAFVLVAVMFLACAIALIVFSALEVWPGLDPRTAMEPRDRVLSVVECIGVLAIAAAALQLSKTISEEEVLREVHETSPSRVRRFLSRFLIVIVISLSIELLVAVFGMIHSDPASLPYAASIGIGAAALLAAWGYFVRANVAAERLEPKGLAEAVEEDEEVREQEGK